MSLPSFNGEYIIYIICSILCFIPALVCHEVAHGFAAYKLGDPTAKIANVIRFEILLIIFSYQIRFLL